MRKRKQKQDEGGSYKKWGDDIGDNQSYTAGKAGDVYLNTIKAPGGMISLTSASTESTISPRAPMNISTLERGVKGPFVTSPPVPVQASNSIPDSAVVASPKRVVIPNYTKAFTLKQYLAAGWTMEQINIVKPPISDDDATENSSLDTLARVDSRRSMQEPVQST
ncbi:hypothetical protein BC829DRAFT_79313 [Chytridium lagenaria]|nr:hypothetical protein BC829DRAFT_79313 [Chytridium lagenaria]